MERIPATRTPATASPRLGELAALGHWARRAYRVRWGLWVGWDR
ncbi:hypothetical protein ABTX62_16975 [Streptomyces sp. NPDC096046]